MKPKLSICIPTYNRSKCLKECLDSILLSATGYENQIEIVISDNASTDDTKVIIDRFVNTYPNIRYFRNDRNIGPDRNLYKVAELATGEYIWIFGDDDKMEQKAISTAMKHITSGYNLIICNYSIWTKDFCFRKSKRGLLVCKKIVFNNPDELMSHFGLNMSYITSIVVKKDVFFTAPYIKYVSFEEYGLCFLYSIYTGVIKYCYAVFIAEPIVCNRSGNCPNFDWFKYFVTGSSVIFDELYKEGYSKDAIFLAKHKVLKNFVIPQFFFMKLQENINSKDVFSAVFPFYKKKWLFWLKGIPILLIPAFFVHFAKKIVELKRRIMGKPHKR
jgi:abequosyltransferase